MEKQYITGRVKEVNTESRTLTAYASTIDLDRDGDVIQPMAWANGLDSFKQNPVLLWGHDYRIPPVGKASNVEIDSKGLKFTASFASTDFANEVWSLYRDGFLNAFSVGFQPEEWTERDGMDGVEFTKAQLLEISAVPVPANPHALVERAVPVMAFKSLDSFKNLPEPETPEPDEEETEESLSTEQNDSENTTPTAEEADTQPNGAQATPPNDTPSLVNDEDNELAPEDEDRLAAALGELVEAVAELIN